MKVEINEENGDNNEPEFMYEDLSPEVSDVFLSGMTRIPQIRIKDYRYFLELHENEEIRKVARDELRETEENVRVGLETLRKLLQNETKLRAPIHNDKFLIRFLRPCKFYPDSAFELIKRYYKFKAKNQDIYEGLLPSNEELIFQQNIIIFQQERDHLGRRVLTIKLGEKWKPDVVSLDDLMKGLILLLELGTLEPTTQICGCVIILDVNKLSLSQATKITPSFIKRLFEWMQDSIPLRIKNIHIVFQPYVFKIVYKLIKMFLRDKFKSRLFLHGSDMQSLQKFIPPERLLEDYGGKVKVPKIEGNPWLRILVECDGEYKAINTYGYLSEAIKNGD